MMIVPLGGGSECQRRHPSTYWLSRQSKWGQVILRHTERTAYRCFLPDLAGFTGFCCTGPGPEDFVIRQG